MLCSFVVVFRLLACTWVAEMASAPPASAARSAVAAAAPAGAVAEPVRRRKHTRKTRRPIHIPLVYTPPADKELRERDQKVQAWMASMKSQPLTKYVDFGFVGVLRKEKDPSILSRIFGADEASPNAAGGAGAGAMASPSTDSNQNSSAEKAKKVAAGGAGGGSGKPLVPTPERYWMADDKCKTCYDCGTEFHFYRRKQYGL